MSPATGRGGAGAGGMASTSSRPTHQLHEPPAEALELARRSVRTMRGAIPAAPVLSRRSRHLARVRDPARGRALYASRQQYFIAGGSAAGHDGAMAHRDLPRGGVRIPSKLSRLHTGDRVVFETAGRWIPAARRTGSARADLADGKISASAASGVTPAEAT